MNPKPVYFFIRRSLEPGKDEPSDATNAVMDLNVPLLPPSMKPPNAPVSDRSGRMTNTIVRNEQRCHGLRLLPVISVWGEFEVRAGEDMAGATEDMTDCINSKFP